MQIQGNVLVDGELLELGDEVPGDGEEEEGVAEGQRTCRPAGYCDACGSIYRLSHIPYCQIGPYKLSS